MKKFIILIALLINMTPVKPGIGTQLREAVYRVDLLRSPSEQLREFSPSVVKSLMNQEIGLKSSQLSRKKNHTNLTKLTQNCHKYFPEFFPRNKSSHEIPMDLSSPIRAITELQDGRLACGSEEGVLKIIAQPGTVCAEIELDGVEIKAIIELHCPDYSGYIAVLLDSGIALINPINFDYTIVEVDESILDNFSLIGFQELKNGPLQGMILVLLDSGLMVFNSFKKKFFPKIDHDLLNNFIEKTFFENAIGNLFFINQNCSITKFSLGTDSEIINIGIKRYSIPGTDKPTNIYRYLFNKKGIVTFSGFNKIYNPHKGKFNIPDILHNGLGTYQSIFPLKNNSQWACFLENQALLIVQGTDCYSPPLKIATITELKDGNLALGLQNGNIIILTICDTEAKNLSIHQIALLVNLIKASTRPSCGPLPPLYMHPEWHDIFITLPEVYQNRFKNMIATVDRSQESSLLSKNSHPNPGKQNQDAKRLLH